MNDAGLLEASLGRSEGTLEPSWGGLEGSWRQCGSYIEPHWAILRDLGGHPGLSGALFKPYGAVLEAPTTRGAPRPGPGERGARGGVNPSPKGKHGFGRGSPLGNLRPKGLAGFATRNPPARRPSYGATHREPWQIRYHRNSRRHPWGTSHTERPVRQHGKNERIAATTPTTWHQQYTIIKRHPYVIRGDMRKHWNVRYHHRAPTRTQGSAENMATLETTPYGQEEPNHTIQRHSRAPCARRRDKNDRIATRLMHSLLAHVMMMVLEAMTTTTMTTMMTLMMAMVMTTTAMKVAATTTTMAAMMTTTLVTRRPRRRPTLQALNVTVDTGAAPLGLPLLIQEDLLRGFHRDDVRGRALALANPLSANVRGLDLKGAIVELDLLARALEGGARRLQHIL